MAVRYYNFSSSQLSTLVGGETATPYADGDKDNAGFGAINGLFLDENDLIYIVDRHGLRHVDGAGTVTTLTGGGTQG